MFTKENITGVLVHDTRKPFMKEYIFKVCWHFGKFVKGGTARGYYSLVSVCTDGFIAPPKTADEMIEILNEHYVRVEQESIDVSFFGR